MTPRSEPARAWRPTEEQSAVRQSQPAVTRLALAVVLLVLAASCSDTSEHAKIAATRIAVPVTQLDSVARAEAGAVASSRLAVHFAGEQGFSRTTLRARADTAYAEFGVPDGAGVGTRDATPAVTLVLVRSADRWRIADILNGQHSLVVGIRASLSATGR